MEGKKEFPGKLPELPDLLLDGLRASVEAGVGVDELMALTMVAMGVGQMPDSCRTSGALGRVRRAVEVMEGDVKNLSDQRDLRRRVKKVMAKRKRAGKKAGKRR